MTAPSTPQSVRQNVHQSSGDAPKPPEPIRTDGRQNLLGALSYSISGIRQGNRLSENGDPGEKKEESPKKNAPFTPQTLKHLWKEYGRKFEEGSGHILTGFFGQYTPRETDDPLHYIVTVDSATLKNAFLEEYHAGFRDFLADRLNNDSFVIDVPVVPKEAEKIPLTPKEKLDFLTEKNPELKTLIDELGLHPAG